MEISFYWLGDIFVLLQNGHHATASERTECSLVRRPQKDVLAINLNRLGGFTTIHPRASMVSADLTPQRRRYLDEKRLEEIQEDLADLKEINLRRRYLACEAAVTNGGLMDSCCCSFINWSMVRAVLMNLCEKACLVASSTRSPTRSHSSDAKSRIGYQNDLI